MGVCFDSNGNLAPCVGSSAGSFEPGTGITFTGTNPTTISAVPQPAGTVFGAGASVVGNVPSLSNTTTNSIVDSGNPAAALPTTIGQLPAATPSAAPATISIASPAVITLTGHGLAPNSTIVFSTTGALPMGLTAGTEYYVIGSSITTNTFEVATSLANAKAGTAVNTSGSQSGTQTATANLNADAGNVGNIVEFDVPAGSAVTMVTQHHIHDCIRKSSCWTLAYLGQRGLLCAGQHCVYRDARFHEFDQQFDPNSAITCSARSVCYRPNRDYSNAYLPSVLHCNHPNLSCSQHNRNFRQPYAGLRAHLGSTVAVEDNAER
jgi:hypothetical protein